MITRKELKSKLILKNINCYETLVQGGDTQVIYMADNNIETLIGFAKDNGIKNIFYFFRYFTKDTFYVKVDKVRNFDFNQIPEAKEEKDRQNELLELIDFSRPSSIQAFCFYEGRYIAVKLEDDWYLEYGILPAYEKTQEIIAKNTIALEEILKEQHLEEELNQKEYELLEEWKQKEYELLLEKFKNLVLKDAEFKQCTFPGARRDYARSVFTTRKDTEKYRHLFYKDDDVDYTDKTKAADFIESLWRECQSHR